ncbi:hypothetical protein Rsub_13166 [Raphidocelis subcapitata]|uniref:GCK domain-containing protein n=1 Tax=Raphidocelis subcapitata TaxID=307507 RepID=A0A2V0PMU3_9CHLO|nr:hypothetical protein Rsub_13166 [Raphidocelis subcapitata]|eukprot:GBG00423.1 hypothetical protein Rsub_13166 [Raphidocelis subcapitata]
MSSEGAPSTSGAAAPPAQAQAAAAAAAAAAGGGQPQKPDPDEDDPSNCPICAYIESGPCSGEHVGWRECKSAAKQEDPGGDWVERCTGEFKALLACMLRHRDYHEPLFDALQMDVEGTQQKMGAEGGGGGGGSGSGSGGSSGSGSGSGGGESGESGSGSGSGGGGSSGGKGP